MSKALRPLFVTVTWGAGGSTASRSLELAEICQQQLGLTTCLHLTCTNMNKRIIDESLRTAKDLGIRNILALRGDPPREHEYRIDSHDFEGSEDYKWAVDLVRYIKSQYGNFFSIGVAGYPEGHSDESHPIGQDPKRDMPSLLEKVEAGADFIMTQLFFDTAAYLSYEKLVREWEDGAMKNVIIIPALMPIQSYAVLKRTTDLSHASVPREISERLTAVKSNDDNVKKVGVDILSDLVMQIQATPSPQHRGFHFFTLNLEKVVSLVLEKCHLIPQVDEDLHNGTKPETNHTPLTNGIHTPSPEISVTQPSDRRSQIPQVQVTSTAIPEPPSQASTLAIMHGIGSMGREATWDDYPNGRFGNPRSPAFGEIDGYGTSLHLSPAAARLKWGHPESRADIGKLFNKHLRGQLDQLPWSEGPLNAETRVIQPQLCRLIEERGWWSIASQPAVNGATSSDPIFGWGPRGGFVFQKAFVEFWIPASDWHNTLKPHLTKSENHGLTSWFAMSNPQVPAGRPMILNGTSGTNGHDSFSNRTPDGTIFESNSPAQSVDSVTWGVFRCKEIVSPTIIEEMSFRAWVEEAFGIWREWERCYTADSPARNTIKDCRENMWLVNVIGHEYPEPDGLWDLLLSA